MLHNIHEVAMSSKPKVKPRSKSPDGDGGAAALPVASPHVDDDGVEARRQDDARRRLKETRASEEAYAAINLPLIHADWMQRMRKSKLQELRRTAAELLAQQTARQERRAGALQARRQAATEAGAQLATARQAHLKVLDLLLSLHEGSMVAVLERHAAAVTELQGQFAEERGQAEQWHAAKRQALLQGMEGLQRAHAEAEQAAAGAHALQQRQLMELWDERSGVVRLVAEEKARALSSALSAESAAFREATASDWARHAELAAADEEACDQIQAQAERLRQLQAGISLWRRRLAEGEAQWRQEGAAARAAKGEALRLHAALQRELGAARKAHEAKLKATSSSYAAVEGGLRENVERAERILKANELHAKLESRGLARRHHEQQQEQPQEQQEQAELEAVSAAAEVAPRAASALGE